MNATSSSALAFDLVIAGAAMSGATLALALKHLTHSGLKIALIESAAPEEKQPEDDARSIALAFGSCLLLNKIGLWEALSPYSTPITKIHVSDKGHWGFTNIQANTENLPFLGGVISLSKAEQIYLEAINKAKNISLFRPALITKINREIQETTLTLNTGQTIKTKLLVAADGGRSSCCDLLKIPRLEHDFHQSAIIANITTSKLHQNQAFERFTEQGPLAFLPLSQNRSSVVWCMTPSHATKIGSFDDAEFIEALQKEFGWRLGKILQTGKRVLYPLRLRQSAQLISHRFAVVGNAAQTLHPIAGQGFNLGLRDVMTLAQNIAHSYENKLDIGEMARLQAYRKQREPDRDATVCMISQLVYGFSNASPLLVFFRNMGLIGMSVCPKTMRAPFLKRATGRFKGL